MRRRIERPLSPHLQIYSPMLTMMMSIAHRISGILLYFGTFLLAWWLIAAATGPHYFGLVNGHFSSNTGRFVMLAYTWALLHHLLGGIRHLVWDTGAGLEKKTVEWMARITLAGSLVLTVLVWYLAYWARGHI